jgi:hypothetical protein
MNEGPLRRSALRIESTRPGRLEMVSPGEESPVDSSGCLLPLLLVGQSPGVTRLPGMPRCESTRLVPGDTPYGVVQGLIGCWLEPAACFSGVQGPRCVGHARFLARHLPESFFRLQVLQESDVFSMRHREPHHHEPIHPQPPPRKPVGRLRVAAADEPARPAHTPRRAPASPAARLRDVGPKDASPQWGVAPAGSEAPPAAPPSSPYAAR